MVRIKVRVRWQPCSRHSANNCRMGKSTTLGVRKDVDFNLPDATRELISERSMTIVQASQSLGIIHFQIFALARRKACVIAVM